MQYLALDKPFVGTEHNCGKLSGEWLEHSLGHGETRRIPNYHSCQTSVFTIEQEKSKKDHVLSLLLLDVDPPHQLIEAKPLPAIHDVNDRKERWLLQRYQKSVDFSPILVPWYFVICLIGGHVNVCHFLSRLP